MPKKKLCVKEIDLSYDIFRISKSNNWTKNFTPPTENLLPKKPRKPY